MAFVTFFAKNKYVALCRLTRAMVLGRSLDCDIFVPDAFVSRQHCRIEHTPGGWVITDLGSSNGIHVDGMRVARHVMRENDIVEIGTIAIEFHEGNVGDYVASSTVPFGAATPISELMDTVFAQGLRPVDFSSRTLRRELWAAKAAGIEAMEIDAEGMEPLPGRYAEEWVELDIEWQLADNTIYTDARIRGGWEWTDLDLDLESWPALPAPGDEARGVAGGPPLIELEDGSGDYAPAELAQRQEHRGEQGRGGYAEAVSAAVRRYDEEHSPAPGKASKVWRVSGKGPSLGEKIRTAVEDFRDSELVERLRQSPKHWIGLAAVLAVVIYAGMWTKRQIGRPPLKLSDGKPNPAYFNGDDHS